MSEKPLKHTPGPWTKWVGHLSVHAGVGEMDPGTLRGRKRGEPMPQIAECGDDDISMHEAISNAALIAAAPDLLDALRALVSNRHIHEASPRDACGKCRGDIRSPVHFGPGESRKSDVQRAKDAIKQATELSDDDFFAHEMELDDEAEPEDDAEEA